MKTQQLQARRGLFLSLTLIVFFALVGMLILLTKPEAARRPSPPPAKIQVAVQEIRPQDLEVRVNSYGLVAPLTRSDLVARVSGVVVFVDESFREGGRFKKGQVLLNLDTADYEVELESARADVAQAESLYINEQALAAEARASWKSSGRNQTPPPLAVREPQVSAAKAALQSAQAKASRAELNLARTKIIAPFDGQVLSQLVDRGQLVTVNTGLAEIFSSEAAEVKLPIKNRDLSLLDLQNLTVKKEDPTGKEKKSGAAQVTFYSQLGEQAEWQGHIQRVASAIDDTSRQLNIIARIPSPFESPDGEKPPLKVGEYLRAEIIGKKLQNVISIPNSAVYQNSYVYVLENGQVIRRDVELTWSNTEVSVVKSGLSDGEMLVLTALGQVPSGTAAVIAGQNPRTEQTNAAKPDKEKNRPEGSVRPNESSKPGGRTQ